MLGNTRQMQKVEELADCNNIELKYDITIVWGGGEGGIEMMTLLGMEHLDSKIKLIIKLIEYAFILLLLPPRYLRCYKKFVLNTLEVNRLVHEIIEYSLS